eukprot:CAMPEP_0170283384 /NCGR_PEP_ID=MMETSP0116_2-20130129/41724_1 /TAXON_ID=400756 /ORGANISM="Durinskia baltica, Strain CSIRO CS-38" /LENGTH=146 /DNA_ID=CAMNT_0010534751 /DNA_START=68 /DNA_END=508 /DNA_ORIENTATION=+
MLACCLRKPPMRTSKISNALSPSFNACRKSRELFMTRLVNPSTKTRRMSRPSPGRSRTRIRGRGAPLKSANKSVITPPWINIKDARKTNVVPGLFSMPSANASKARGSKPSPAAASPPFADVSGAGANQRVAFTRPCLPVDDNEAA